MLWMTQMKSKNRLIHAVEIHNFWNNMLVRWRSHYEFYFYSIQKARWSKAGLCWTWSKLYTSKTSVRLWTSKEVSQPSGHMSILKWMSSQQHVAAIRHAAPHNFSISWKALEHTVVRVIVVVRKITQNESCSLFSSVTTHTFTRIFPCRRQPLLIHSKAATNSHSIVQHTHKHTKRSCAQLFKRYLRAVGEAAFVHQFQFSVTHSVERTCFIKNIFRTRIYSLT